MGNRIAVILLASSCLAAASARADSFDKIKARLAEAKCVHLEFASILSSRIFKQTDTTSGTAYISQDGRYRVTVGSDVYLCDGKELYSYSRDNNQVTVQKVDSTTAFSKEVSYITRLDEFFKTNVVTADRVYKLALTSTKMQNLPDSMTVTIDRKSLKIVQIEYLDINSEPTRIIFKKETSSPTCDDRKFVPDFPDSVQRIRM